MIVEFTGKKVTTTDKAALFELGPDHQLWIPHSAKENRTDHDCNKYKVWDSYKHKVTRLGSDSLAGVYEFFTKEEIEE